MSSPSDPTDDDDPVSSVLITGPAESLSGLATAPGIDLVRGSTTDLDDQTRTVVAYATDAAISGLQQLENSGITFTLLADQAALLERWNTVQQQVE
jgi:hypothetical protein